jgi:hypothetical protein
LHSDRQEAINIVAVHLSTSASTLPNAARVQILIDMKNKYILAFALTLLAAGSALAATSGATGNSSRPVEDRQLGRLIGLINNRFPDSAANLKTVTVHVDGKGQTQLVQLVPRQNSAKTDTLSRQLRKVNLGTTTGDCRGKHIKLTFLH